MAVMTVAVIVLAIVLTVGVVAWFVLNRKNPENAASHSEPDRHGSALLHGDVSERPAGPGAEADGVAGAGSPAPGPSADSAGLDGRGSGAGTSGPAP